MSKTMDVNVVELLEYLQDTIENSPKVPISGKTMVDRKELLEIIDQIINYLPDQFKKAQWITNERDRILADAKKEYESMKKETADMMRQNIENHDIVKEAKIRGDEIIAAAKRDAKAIRLGSRDYSQDMLSSLDEEILKKKEELMKSLQDAFQNAAEGIDKQLTSVSDTISENIQELKDMKK